MADDKYLLRYGDGEEKEVTKEDWIRAERNAGFRPKLPHDHPNFMKVCATGGFGSRSNVEGRVKYSREG